MEKLKDSNYMLNNKHSYFINSTNIGLMYVEKHLIENLNQW